MLHNPTTKAFVQIELAAVVDAGEAFAKDTYSLEGVVLLYLYALKSWALWVPACK